MDRNSSEIHLTVDSNAHSIEFFVRDGRTHVVKVAPNLVNALNLESAEVLCTAKGYDSAILREQMRKKNTKANIPKKSNTKSSNDLHRLVLI